MSLFKRLFKKEEKVDAPPPEVHIPEKCKGCEGLVVVRSEAKCNGGNRKRRRRLYNCRVKVKRN